MSLRTLLGRHDVMRILREVPGIPCAVAAALCGMENESSESEDAKVSIATGRTRSEPRSKPPPPLSQRLVEAPSDVSFLRMVESKPISNTAEEEGKEPHNKEIDLDHLEPLPESDFDAVQVPRPTHPELLPWPRLWPFLRRALGGRREGRRLDTGRLLADFAALRPVTRLPLLRYPAWPESLRVLFDWRPDLSVFWEDMNQVLRRLRAVHARQRVRLSWKTEDRRVPDREEAVLVLGDLGLYLRDGAVLKEWRDYGAKLQRAGVRRAALAPVPRDRWDCGLARVWSMGCWDRGQSPPRSGAGQSVRPPRPVHSTGGNAPTRFVETLLTLLSPLARVEPGLLRCLRLVPAFRGSDVGTEYETWNDPRMSEGTSARVVQPGEAQGLIRKLAGSSDPIETAVRPLLRDWSLRWNPGVSRVIRALETICLARAGVSIPPAELEEATMVRRRAVATYYRLARRGRRVEAASLGFWGWQERELARADLAGPDSGDPILSGAFAIRRHWTESEALSHPPELDGKRIVQVLKRLTDEPATDTTWEITWRGGDIVLHVCDRSRLRGSTGGMSTGSPLGLIRARWTLFEMKAELLDESPKAQILGQAGVAQVSAAVHSVQRLTVMSDRDVAVLERSPKPEWATRMGQDRFGGFADLEIRGVPFRMRWIPPGTFLMGSPEDEQGRFDNEGPQHWVTITRGYWLAETPCTQALWEAVMGKNPSHFKGPRRPVESVDWNQCRSFCGRMGREVPGLMFRLPTEAEWEYACRAGTETAFNDGSECTDPEGVDLALECLGWYLQNSVGKTHAVGTKAQNAWGLYDMHGNVWEWCADGLSEYRSEAETDPKWSTAEGARRVLRGGGFRDDPGGCRSAYRSEGGPGNRDGIFGFRLAADQVASGGEGLIVEASANADQPKLEMACLTPTIGEKQFGAKMTEYLGRPFEVWWEVRAIGNAAVRGAVIEMSIPSGLTFRSATHGGLAENGKVLWNFRSLAAGASERVGVRLSGASAGIYSFSASARGERADPIEAVGEVILHGEGAILVEVVGDPTALQVGGEINYTIRVTNLSRGGELEHVVVKAMFPSGIVPIGAYSGGVISGDTVTWAAVPSLLLKQALTYKVKGKGLKAGVAKIRIDVTTNQRITPITEIESTTVF